MKITRFILAVHCHQPVGNFGWVFEEAYSSAYRPFVDALERHPAVRVVFHYSGPLLDWFQKEHPDFLRRLQTLARRGQAEFLGGGYYEPILVMIPDRDALGQLQMMREALRRLKLSPTAGKGPGGQGVWLAERVWEPSVPSLLKRADVRYAVVDDHHLALAGIPEEDRFGYYLTEDRGDRVALFPSSKQLRYLVPFKPVEEVIGVLSQWRSESGRVVVLADDGEKFGLWPGTHAWVYQEGWLESFFQEIERNQDWLKMTTFEEALEALPPMGTVYVPCASYEEMLTWSGGSFRNFLAKYPEADTMYKKMLWVSRRLEEAQAKAVKPRRPASVARHVQEARRHLYMAQSNDAYWHGVFGGLYLRHLRRAVYHHLLLAERALDELEEKGSWVRGQEQDLDADGAPEVLLRSKTMTLLLDSNRGGQLLELSCKEAGWNLLDTLTRRPEPYHQKVLSKEPVPSAASQAGGPLSIHERGEATHPELADLLVYDPYRRAALIDHIFSPQAQVHEFSKGAAEELGDFVQYPYQAKLERLGSTVRAVLTRKGRVALEGRSHPLNLTKKITLARSGQSVQVAYRLTNPARHRFSFLFGVEWNLNLKDAHVNRIGDAEQIRRFAVTDPVVHRTVSWAFSREARLWYFPIETVSDSERGVERTYQGVNLTFLWPVELSPGGSWEVACELSLEAADDKS